MLSGVKFVFGDENKCVQDDISIFNVFLAELDTKDYSLPTRSYECTFSLCTPSLTFGLI
jgi:hypothetical protein